MTDESNGDVLPIGSRGLDGEVRRSGGTEPPVTDTTGPDGTLQYEGDVARVAGDIGDLLLGVTRQVVDSGSRDAVERTVCERLVDSSHYRSAWMGEYVPTSDGITVQRSAGLEDRCPDAVPFGADGDPTGPCAPERVLAAGTVQVLDPDDPGFEQWWGTDGECGIASASVVPLAHDGTVYGLLAVATARPGAFDAFERDALSAVGEVVGATYGAIRNRDLLFADGVVELELRVTDRASFLVRASDELACRLSVEGYVAAGDQWLLYCDVEGADAEVVTANASEYPAVDDCRVIQNREGRRRLELTVADSSLLCQAAAAGARVRSTVADRGVCRAVVEVPGSATVREVVSRFRGTYPDLDLLSLREHDRPPVDPTVSGGVLEDMTERQRDVLEAAYRAGYFDWPRESTAEEVAAGLGISGPTFLGHVRKAEKRLLGDLFE